MRRGDQTFSVDLRRVGPALVVLLLMVVLAACSGETGEQGPQGEQGPPGPQGEQGPAGPAGESASMADLSCVGCHDDSTIITGKAASVGVSRHGTGESFVRGASASCAGCHSGGAFTEMIAAGGNPGAIEEGDPDPTRQDCKACHLIHTTYTGEDWALTTTDPVALYAVEGATFDGGSGNLCTNCHQPRRVFPEATDGMVEITSIHWGPHHGPQSAMLLGLAGAGAEGSAGSHYSQVEGTCVTCHTGGALSHTFEAKIESCQACHSGAEDFDINGLQTEVQASLDELEAELVARGLLDEEGHPAVETVPEGEAVALWNWIYIAHEDKSLGVHNPAYTKALLEESFAGLAGGGS